jgi:hypothetical protein
MELSAGGVYEAYTPSGYSLVRGQAGSDYSRAKKLACDLLDWTAAGYQLQYHPSGDIAVLVESRDRVPRDRIIYTAPRATRLAGLGPELKQR